MQPAERIKVLVQLGKRLKAADEYRDAVIHRTFFNNKWFTKENQNQAITAIADSFLEATKLEEWLQKYAITNPVQQKKVGLVLAGNIPLVGLSLLNSCIKEVKSLTKMLQFVFLTHAWYIPRLSVE